jgi:hypothetical protein
VRCPSIRKRKVLSREGAISTYLRAGSRHDAMVPPKITRREVGGFGKVSGNIYANDRVGNPQSRFVDRRCDRTAHKRWRLFKGDIGISKPGREKGGVVVARGRGRGPITRALVGK